MCRVVCVLAMLTATAFAAPVPSEPDAKALVAKLSDPEEKVRDEASAALKGRTDALPWLRRASRSRVPITAARADKLLAPHETKRQEAVPKAIDACIRDGCADLFVEWHQFWKPKDKDDLWPVGPRMGKAALRATDSIKLPGEENWLEHWIAVNASENRPARYHDGPLTSDRPIPDGAWHVRTDQLCDPQRPFTFASVNGPISDLWLRDAYFYSLGPVYTARVESVCALCDGPIEVRRLIHREQPRYGAIYVSNCFLACRGEVQTISNVYNSVLAVDGDIDLSHASEIKNSLIRASGEIRLPPKVKPENCKIEAHAKTATAPYKFFELSDVGLSLADDEEGLVVTNAKAETPFGNCGLAKGDLIRLIDDAPAGHSEEFRKLVRRALVRQGDCLLTVARGDKTIDLPVFFPLPK